MVEDSQDGRHGEGDEAVAVPPIVRSGGSEGAAILPETIDVELDGGLGMQRIRAFKTLPSKRFRRGEARRGRGGGGVEGEIFREAGRIVGKQLAIQRRLRFFTDSYPERENFSSFILLANNWSNEMSVCHAQSCGSGSWKQKQKAAIIYGSGSDKHKMNGSRSGSSKKNIWIGSGSNKSLLPSLLYLK